MKIYIYDKEKFIDGYFIDEKEKFIKNPLNYCNTWKEGYIISDVQYNFPIYEDGSLREATKEERILKFGKIEELSEGEVIENNEIKIIEKPLSLICQVWNDKKGMWEESMTKKELLLKRKNKIIKYIDIKNEIEKLTESEFESEETVTILEHQLQKLKSEINELAEYVKHLKGDDTHEN